MRTVAAFGVLLAFAIAGRASAADVPAGAGRIRHVFVILLENQAYGDTFGPSSRAPYLSQTLPRLGAVLSQYYAIGHNSLGNYIALVSGQAPNRATQGDCVRYSEFRLSAPGLDPHGQALGEGCVYPSSVVTLPDELEAAGLTWKGYMEDMGRDPAREARVCGHAALDSWDPLLEATARDQYASKHNPFVYFHSIIDDAARCGRHVVNLEALPADLQSSATTPNFVFITPNLCHDGHDAPCVDGQPGGLTSADAFLREWVPRILSSAAFREDGLLVITFDESSAFGAEAVSACCGEQGLPGARYPPGLAGPGGGRVGALLLSPFIAPGTVSSRPFNHYALLRSIAQIFGVRPLGYAADPGLPSLAEVLGPLTH